MAELLIESDRIERQYWRDLWRYRELFFFFVWRDLLVRYKQTLVGISWSLVRPLLTMIVLTVVFKTAQAAFRRDTLPFTCKFCGMLPWQFFSAAMTESGNSLVSNANMISKVYFPRLVITVSSVMTNLVDFFISTIFLVGLLIWYRFVPPLTVLMLPFFVLLLFGAALGVVLWFAALMVEYRDFRFHRPLLDSIWSLRFARRFPEQHRTDPLSHPLRAQPHGGNH